MPSDRTSEGARDQIPKEELARRVVYSLLAPAARVGRAFKLPLSELRDWAELAYFHELRASGRKQREIAEALGVSMRSVANLSSRLKQNFLDPEREVGLPRRIEFMLWAEDLSLARLQQVLSSEDPAAIDAAVASLVAEGRIVEIEGPRPVYSVTRSENRLYSDMWLARVDGLNHLVSTVSAAVFGRFFAGEPRSFARTIGLRVRPEDLPKLRALYEEQIWPALKALDDAAAADGDAEAIDIALCWAPNDTNYEPDATPAPSEGEA